MNDPLPLEDLLDRWEQAREEGQPLSPEQLCANQPELLEPLKKKIAAIEAFDRCVAAPDDPTAPSPLERAFVDESTRVKKDQPEILDYHSRLVDLQMHERGGLGVVYRGIDEKLNRNVAIKFIQPRHARNENLCQRFMQEAEITGRLDHPGIVPVYAIGTTDNGQPFYSMRFIRGESLDSQIKRFHQQQSDVNSGDRRLQLHKMLNSMISVCRTIAYAHTRGIVHRDLKPQNIMLGKYGEALVVDWGLALPIGRESRFRVSDETTLRPVLESDLRPDMGEGTPVYMSPEQASGQQTISPASDIYSLGVTLYKLLTGLLAFNGMNAIEVRSKIIAGDFKPPSHYVSSLARPLESICLKAMALDPYERYETASDLADDLEAWLSDNHVTAHDYSWRERVWRWTRRNAGWVAGAAASLLILGAASTLLSTTNARQFRRELRLQGDAIVALQNARNSQTESRDMTARVAAKSMRMTLEASVAAIEELASDEKLIQLLSGDTPAESQRAIADLLDAARLSNEEALHAISWFALDKDGVLLARSSDMTSIIKARQPLWMRPYFHGGELNLSSDIAPADRPRPLDRTSLSPVFIGKGKGWRLCSLSTPVVDNHQNPVGVVGMTIQVGRFDPADSLGDSNLNRVVALAETRGELAGSLIHHPGISRDDSDEAGATTTVEIAVASDARLGDSLLQQLTALPEDVTQPTPLNNYVDPVGGPFEDQWLAVTIPVRVHSRQYGWLQCGWYLIVQDRPYEVTATEVARQP